jgi:CubicO group peptidase (beta-lactamase class C family)
LISIFFSWREKLNLKIINWNRIITFLIIIIIIIGNCSNIHAFYLTLNRNEESEPTDFNDPIFDLKIKSLMKIGSYPSLSISTIENDQILWLKIYGYKDWYHKIKPDKHTIYVIGSISKTITAVAVMQLYEQGYFDLDDDINKYLPFSLRNPNFPDESITFRMLLSHRSSIYDYHIYTKQGQIEFLNCFLMINDLCEIVKEFLIPGGRWYHPDCWLNSPPGEIAVYSSFDMLVLSYIIEQISGQSFEDYCQKHIFQPLQMNDSFFHPRVNNTDNLAIGYMRLMRLYVPLPCYDTKCLCSIGGIHTSIEDLSHFLIALINKGYYNDKFILNESSVNEMINTIYPEEMYPTFLPHVYGLGVLSTKKFGEKLVGHGGGAPGYLCDMYMNTTSRKGFIMFSNHCNIGSPTNPLAALRLYPKTHIVRTKIGQLIMEEIND